MTIKDVMKKHGVSMTQLSKRFGIPYRTIQGWTAETEKAARSCPDYIVRMVDEILTADESKTE